MTFEKITLPSGGWAELRDPETVTERQRRPVRRVQMRLGFDSDLQALIRHQMRVQRELSIAKQSAEEAGEKFNAEEFEPSTPPPVHQFALSDEQIDLIGDLAEALTVALVESWSFGAPVQVDALQDLPADDYDALVEAAGKHRDALIPNFGVDPEPDSPTEPSGESETP